MSMTKPQNGCGISLYVRKSLEPGQPSPLPERPDSESNNTHFMTSRSDGSSDEMSKVNLSRWREDISGKGAELSRPSRERMSWRIPLTSWGSLAEVCSRSKAGMLFWPT